MEKYEYNQAFTIEYCDVDFKDDLKISTALAYMEEVASASADELGFGYAFVKEKGCSFIVANTCLEIVRPFRVGEKIVAKTWPRKPSYVAFERDYLFVDEQGEIVVKASSRWCLMEMKTGKIMPSKIVENQDYSTYNTDKVFETVQWKIPTFDVAEKEADFVITIANSEYDHNFHVNNTRYADYCLNVFSVGELSTRFVRDFSISYVRQGKEKDVLRFYKQEIGEETYLVQGVNQHDEIVVQAKIAFGKKGE